MRLLIASGGSAHSEAALHLGVHILRRHNVGETPTVITVIKNEAEQPQATKILAHASETLSVGRQGSEVQLEIRVGQPVEEIIREAQAGHYDLVIVGERAGHRLVTRFFGSTAIRVMEQAPCPVLIAKGKIGPIRRILLCDSGAESTSLLQRFTAQLAELAESEVDITVLHVMSQMSAGPGVRGQQLRADAAELIQEHAPEGELLAQDVQILTKADIHPSPKVRHGLVVNEILDEARSGDYDLVVIGAYRNEGWRHLLLDNLAHQIIAGLDRPILVVR